MNASTEPKCCEVPADLHGTCCGWANATAQCNPAGNIIDLRHPGFGQLLGNWKVAILKESTPSTEQDIAEYRANIQACYADHDAALAKKTEQESQEAVQDRLWIEVLDLYSEIKEHSAGRMLQELRKQFTITRKP